jgi:hypothetical protein
VDNRGHTTRRRLAITWVVVLLTFVAATAGADGLTFLAPERVPGASFVIGLVSLDGQGLAKPTRAVVTATGATLEELTRRGPVRAFLVRPAGQVPVQLQAREADGPNAAATVEVGPPAARVELSTNPAAPVKNLDETATLEISVRRGDGRPDPDAAPPVLRSNVGAISELKPLGGGRFSAVYRLPEERYPEVAIVVAFAPWPHADATEGALGALAVPLSSAVSLPGRTEAKANVSIHIAGKIFGPVVADDKGAFELPVIVPPGHRFGTSETMDRLGNKRKKQVDLRLPPTDQLSCVANPPTLPADGVSKARVICLATDPYGAVASGARITGKARAGRLEGPRARGDAFEWEYTAPAAGDSDELSFDYPAGGPQSKERVKLTFRPQALAQAKLEITPQPVFVGGSAQVSLRTFDRAGRPVGAQPSLSARRGVVAQFQPSAPGVLTAQFQPPSDEGDWTDVVSGTVLGLSGVVPARLRLSLSGQRLLASAQDVSGAPVPNLTLLLGEAKAKTGTDGVATFELPTSRSALEPLVVRLADRSSLQAPAWRVRAPEGESLFPDEGPFQALAVEAAVALAPATPVDVRLEFTKSGIQASVLNVAGKVIPGRKIAFSVTRQGRPVTLGAPHEEADGSVQVSFAEKVSGAVSASASDVESGVTAAQEAVLP